MTNLFIENITTYAAVITFLVLLKMAAVWLLENVRASQLKKIQHKAENQKAANYQLAKSNYKKYSQLYKAGLLLAVLFSDILGVSYNFINANIGGAFLTNAIFTFLCLVALELAMFPFSIYELFILEGRFGFNTTTIKLYLTDSLKKFIISIIFFIVLFSPIYYLFIYLQNYWWLAASLVYAVFVFAIQLIFPKYIYPLFNKLTPVKDGQLIKELNHLAAKTNFNVNKVFVSDGSKRSRHQNAFFAGMGKSRMVVLYDTLVESLSIDELKAVLAHEIGHAKLGHIKRNIFINLATAPVIFFMLHLLVHNANLQSAFGLQSATFAGGMLIFFFYGACVSFWLQPISNLRSWKFEYEADAYSKKQMGSEKPILKALEKLHKENLALTPKSSLYKIFYQSHPTYEERRNALL